MPDRTKPGTQIYLSLHDDVPVDNYDRFTVRLGAPESRLAAGDEWTEASYI